MENNLTGMMASRPNNNSNSVSIGNYKGVMLCNRPFAGTNNGMTSKPKSNEPPPFLSSCQKAEPLGLNPIRYTPLALGQEKDKKDTAISKHKRFIKDLQQQKKNLKKELMEESKLREQRKNRFRQRQEQMRRQVVSLRNGGESKSDDQQKQLLKENYLKTIKPKQPPASKSKPVWAMTADEVELLEEKEVDDLVDFAKGLDFEEYLSDLEVKCALEAVRNRVQRLKSETKHNDDEAKSNNNDDESKYELDDYNDLTEAVPDELLDAADGISVTSYAKSESQRRRKTSSAGEEKVTDYVLQGNEDDGISVGDARSILSTASMKSIRSIHSTKSIAKIAEKVLKSSNSLRSVEEEEAPRNDVVLAPPRIVQIVEDGGSRLKKSEDVNNLPYMHRNPAI